MSFASLLRHSEATRRGCGPALHWRMRIPWHGPCGRSKLYNNAALGAVRAAHCAATSAGARSIVAGDVRARPPGHARTRHIFSLQQEAVRAPWRCLMLTELICRAIPWQPGARCAHGWEKPSQAQRSLPIQFALTKERPWQKPARVFYIPISVCLSSKYLA